MTDIALEKYVLSSLLRTKQKQLAQTMKPEDFTDEIHREVFTAILDRLNKGQKVDYTMMTDTALSTKAAVALSDMEFVTVTVDDGLLKEKIEVLCELSDKRFVVEKSTKLAESITSGKIEKINHIIDSMTNISESLISRHPKELDVSLGQSITLALQRVQKRKGEVKIKTGIHGLDYPLFGGIGLGEYVIFAARPNVGKSIFSIMPAIQAGRAGLDVLVAVNEMDKETTALRMLANISQVDINAIEGHAQFYPGDGESLAAAHDVMNHMPITFLENAYEIEEIEKLLRTRQKLKRPIKLVIVDMAGRMRTANERKTDRERLNDVSKQLARISRTYHCTVIGTVQITRSGLLSEEPQLDHLKETGAWEEDPDKVFMMWEKKDDPARKIIALKKNRTGKKDFRCEVVLDGPRMSFWEDES